MRLLTWIGKKMTINVEPTAKVIDSMVETLIRTSNDLEKTAVRMREKNDITYASEAIQSISNLMNQLRLDLLISRPLREFGER